MGGAGPRYLAALKATPRIGSDGAELARRGYLYGFPLLLESGDGRCVVPAETSPENPAPACQVGPAPHSNDSEGPWRRDGWGLVTFVRGDTDRRREEPGSGPVPLFVRFILSS